MATYHATYPATSQYYEYSQPSYSAYTQPGYTLEAHPYADAYTTNSSHLAPNYHEPRSSPRRSSISPCSSGEYSHTSSSSHGHRRRRSSQVYLEEPTRIVHSSGSPSRRERERAERAAEREEREAREERRRRRREEKASASSSSNNNNNSSSKAVPIPLPRSSTMPTGHSITPAHETRGRRPVIMSEYVDGGGETSARMPIGPVDVLEHASARRNSTTKRYSSTGRYEDHHRRGSSSSHRRHDSNGGSPRGYASGEEEAERRRSHRRSNRAEVRQGPGFATSAPDFGVAYAKSPSPYASSYASTAGSAQLGSSPAPDEATKTLRWADQERRAQNNRISSRPKLARVDPAKANNGAKTQGEVKGILKNSPNSSRPQSSSSSGPRSRGNSVNVDDLTAGVERLSTADRGDDDYRRLKDRFSMPTRRHSTFGPGAGSRDRTEYWADGGRERKYYH